MKQLKVKPNTFTLNLLINACAQSQQLQKAFSLFEEMQSAGVEVTTVSCSAMMNACVKAGEMQLAIKVVNPICLVMVCIY